MKILLHFDRSEALADDTGLAPERVTVPFDAHDGSWVQLTYESIRSHDGGFLYGYDERQGAWVGPDGQLFSDVVIEFQAVADDDASGDYVYDPVEHRCWGPFGDDEAANRFIESDKYLASWCVVISGTRGDVYPPDAYHVTNLEPK